MTWIKTISYDESDGELRQLYDRIKGPDNNVDNIMLAHSLRPHTMQGHMTLYKYVLHHSRNTLPKDYLETIGVYVSLLNRCQYCVNITLPAWRACSAMLPVPERSAPPWKSDARRMHSTVPGWPASITPRS